MWNWRKIFVQLDMVNGERKPPFLEVAQRIAGHADSRTTKLYDRRAEQLLVEDMERIRY